MGCRARRWWVCRVRARLCGLRDSHVALAYVYFGTLGKAAAESASGSGPERGQLEWTLLAVGLADTLVVTIWVSKIARNAIRQGDEIEDAATSD